MSKIMFGWMFLLAGVAWTQTPNELTPTKGQSLLFKFTGKGSQIYVCQNAGGAYTWVLKAPDAQLFDERGELAGKHFAGPTWEAKDSSRVRGKMTASVPSPEAGSIPWLLVTVVSHDGTGIMASVQSIQRLETKGGKAPAEACDRQSDKREIAIPYAAKYYFYGEQR